MTSEQRKAFEKKVRNAIYNTWHNGGIANVDAVARIAVGAISVELAALFTQADLLKACKKALERASKCQFQRYYKNQLGGSYLAGDDDAEYAVRKALEQLQAQGVK